MKIDIYSKKLLFMVLAVLIGLFAVACGGGGEEPEDSSAAASSAKSDADAYAASQKKAEPAAKSEAKEDFDHVNNTLMKLKRFPIIMNIPANQ